MTKRATQKPDLYLRLKPETPTPKEELCTCRVLGDIVLCYALGHNPIRCAICNREVQPERLKLTIKLVDEIANWNSFYGSFYYLWLDSGEYEQWAKEILSDANSIPNQRGLKCCRNLAKKRTCFYWWFQDFDSDDCKPMDTCPKCSKRLFARYERWVCEDCQILVVNGNE